jgi:hypothetical protein
MSRRNILALASTRARAKWKCPWAIATAKTIGGPGWLACHLYERLQLDRFFAPLLPNSREGTNWQHILQTLVC